MAVKGDKRYSRKDTRKRASRKGRKMSEREKVAFLGRKILQAMNSDDDDISETRKENFNYYIGAEYGNERDGYSKFVTRETLETVEWVLPSVLRVFLSGDKVVSFQPVGEEDEAAAEQETDAVNYFIMQSNNNGEGGFLTLHNWTKDALMYPNAYLKVFIDDSEKTDTGRICGLTEYGLQMVFDDPNVEILEQDSRIEYVETPPQEGMASMQPPQGGIMMPQAQPVELFDLKVKTTKKVKNLCIEAIPPEEALVDNDCTSPNLDRADFVAHRRKRTFTDLVTNEGINPSELDQVSQENGHAFNDEKVNRLFFSDENPDASDENDPSMREFWVHECYAYYDEDGSGLAKQHYDLLIGDRVFGSEEINYQPMVSLSAILMPHKHVGMAYIDLVKDLQLLSSILMRQLLDNIYKANVRRKIFSEDALTDDGSTMDAMLNTQAEWIPVRGPAVNAFAPEPVHSIINDILPVIQHVKMTKTERSGVSPETGIDPNTLQEVRQDVFNNAMDRASQRVEMLVRIFAETGFRFLFQKTHQLLRSNWDVAKMVKLRGKWVDVDPQSWRDRTDITVEVGLGFNSKQQTLQIVANMLAAQKEAAQIGLANPKKMYNALEKLVNASGLGDVNDYFVDPTSPEYQPPQPPPDPNMILAQAQARALQAEAQRKAQETPMKLRAERQKMAVDLQDKAMDRAQRDKEFRLRTREAVLKEKELIRDGTLKEKELDAKVKNLTADTQLKYSQSDAAIAKAVEVLVEASETYQEAARIVSQGGELNDGDQSAGPAETEDEEDDTDADR